MRRLFFILSVLGFSGMVLFLSLTTVPKESSIAEISGIDFSEKIETLPFPLDEQTKEKAEILKLSPIAFVTSVSSDAPKFSKTASGISLKIGKGKYFFHLDDIFIDVAIEHSDFHITQIGRGAFYIDTTNPEEIKTFSLSALLEQELLLNGKNITKVQIFPSEYFSYSPKYNSELASADILRVATVNDLRYVDIKTDLWRDILFGRVAESPAFFEANLRFRHEKAKTFSRAFDAMFRLSEHLPESDLAEDFWWYFVNEGKKSALLQGKALRSIRNTALSQRCSGDEKRCPNSQKATDEFLATLTHLDEIDPNARKETIETLKKAYYLSSFQSDSADNAYFQDRVAGAFIPIVARVFPSIHLENADYSLISEIFSAYYFGTTDSEDLEIRLEAYVRSLLGAKALRKSEFLAFSYFLKGYLERPDFRITASSLSIAYSLVAVSNAYYDTLTGNSERFSTLSVLFYTYAKTFERIGAGISKEFFIESEIGRVLKDEYLSSGTPDLPEGFEKKLSELVKVFETTYFQEQKKNYESALVSDSERTIVDTESLLSKAVSELKTYSSIFSNYREYLQKLELSDTSRKASGVIFEKPKKTIQDLKQYFSSFQEVQADSLMVVNDGGNDDFYSIKVPVSSRIFEFKFFPDDGNRMEDIVITEPDGTKVTTYQNFAFSLDEKQEALRIKLSSLSAKDTEKRELYLFENFFVNTFFRSRERDANDLAESNPSVDPNAATNGMSPEMLVFVQRELIEKDFKNLEGIIRIGVPNIFAKISDGEYDIDIRWATAVVSSWDEKSYLLNFSGKYIFETHTFSLLEAEISYPEGNAKYFGGLPVSFFPKRIPLTSIGRILSEMPKYIERTIGITGNSANPTSIGFNFQTKQVIIDGKEYPVQ